MRKLVLTITMALAALALSATPASAVNPDFPFDDTEADNWTQASFTGCTDSFADCPLADPTEWSWSLGPVFGSTVRHGCGALFNGDYGANGMFQVTSANIYEFGEDDSWCRDVQATDLPWVGEACSYGPDSSKWVRLVLDVGDQGPFVTFGQIDGYRIVFGDPGATPWETEGWTDLDKAFYGGRWKHKTFFYGPATSTTSSPCGWPELA